MLALLFCDLRICPHMVWRLDMCLAVAGSRWLIFIVPVIFLLARGKCRKLIGFRCILSTFGVERIFRSSFCVGEVARETFGAERPQDTGGGVLSRCVIIGHDDSVVRCDRFMDGMMIPDLRGVEGGDSSVLLSLFFIILRHPEILQKFTNTIQCHPVTIQKFTNTI